MKRQIARYGSSVVAIVFIMIVAAVAGGYILLQQRLRPPLSERYTVRAEFRTSTALTPGLGQPVNVAGVKVGQIADVTLRDGRAIVEMEIDPDELESVGRDASAVLVPRTALKDMQVELLPGRRSSPRLPEGGEIPVARTEAPIDSDELLGALDADTRDFFTILIAEGSRGIDGRGQDLRQLIRALGPTLEQTRDVAGALASRRRELRRLVHSLSVLGRTAGRKDSELVRIVEAGDATLGALAAEERALRTSVRGLPGAVRAASDSLASMDEFAAEVRPTLRALRPATRKLPAALRALGPLASEAEPIVRTKLRPLTRELQPLAVDLAPTVRSLSAVTPALTTSFQVLTYVANELGFHAGDDQPGYLFWLAWFAHNGASFLSTEDGNGAAWRGLATLSCDTLTAEPGLAAVLRPILPALPVC